MLNNTDTNYEYDIERTLVISDLKNLITDYDWCDAIEPSDYRDMIKTIKIIRNISIKIILDIAKEIQRNSTSCDALEFIADEILSICTTRIKLKEPR